MTAEIRDSWWGFTRPVSGEFRTSHGCELRGFVGIADCAADGVATA